MPGNTKLALGVCHPPDALSQMSQISDFTPPISSVIPPRTMDQSSAAIENRINDALHALSEDLYPYIAAAARDFDVSTRTLQRRINGVGPLSSRLPNNKPLLDAQEQAICEYIERLDSWEMSARPQMIERATNYLLSLDGLDRVVGPQWTRRFLDLHPEYLKHKQKPLAVERKNAHSLKDMEEYFQNFHNLVK